MTVRSAVNPRARRTEQAAVEPLDELAASGRLAAAAAQCPETLAGVSSALYAVVWPIVFDRVTRPLEQLRGHRACMRSMTLLAPECLDAFEDDVDSVIDHVLRFANSPINNLEGWIASRARQACVDGYRRRRGARGALQRPRLPEFISRELDHDPWLCALAVDLLTWVGLPQMAGAGLWPLAEWASRRARWKQYAETGETAELEAELRTVLAALRTNPAWYEKYVERPLGRKQATLCPAAADPCEGEPLRVVSQAEVDDDGMRRLAEDAIDRIQRLLSAGEPPRQVVATVLEEVFGGRHACDMERLPHEDPMLSERVTSVLADRREIERITAVALAILADGALDPRLPG